MSPTIEFSAGSVRAAFVAAHLKPGSGGATLVELITPRLAQIGLEWRPVFQRAGSGDELCPKEHAVLCGMASGKPIDGVVEILTEAPGDGAGQEWLCLGSRYFVNRELADAYCQWRRIRA